MKVFFDDGNVSVDNNAAESSIRGFCIGKHNWHLIDTIDGAKVSAIIYSIALTTKANKLKPYNYFEFLLTEILEHMEDIDLDFLKDLLPFAAKMAAISLCSTHGLTFTFQSCYKLLHLLQRLVDFH